MVTDDDLEEPTHIAAMIGHPIDFKITHTGVC